MRGADPSALGTVEKGGSKAAFDALECHTLQHMHHALHPAGKGGKDKAPEGGGVVHQGQELGLGNEDDGAIRRGHSFARIVVTAEQAEGGLNAGAAGFDGIEEDVATGCTDQEHLDPPVEHQDKALRRVAGMEKRGPAPYDGRKKA